jgi:hypoxanthine phosphoribosyltransferase
VNDIYRDPSTLEVLLSAEQIQARVAELGTEISEHYQEQELYVVGILKGAFVFAADLLRQLRIPCQVHFIEASSYGQGKESSGVVTMRHKLEVQGKHVLLVEDIYDTGNTLLQVMNDLQQQQPASLEACALLNKDIPEKQNISLKFQGFEIPPRFVVGYGLDYAEYYRELPYIACLD